MNSSVLNKISERRNCRNLGWVLLCVLIITGCSFFEDEDKQDSPCTFSQHPAFKDIPRFTDFGCEDGYFIYTTNMDKVPWKRNRNFVSIEFYYETSEQDLHEILKEFDLYYVSRVWPIKHIFARVKSKPAEFYYTSYGDSTLPKLGNRPEVKYALPVYVNEILQPVMLTNSILLTFNPELTENEHIAILDSLREVDHLIRLPDLNGVPPFFLQVTKATTKNPLALVNHYMETIDAISVAGVNYAFMINYINFF